MGGDDFRAWSRPPSGAEGWDEISPGMGVWVCKIPHRGGVTLVAYNGTGGVVSLHFDFAMSRNAETFDFRTGRRISSKKTAIGPRCCKEVVRYVALDPLQSMECSFTASCSRMPYHASAHQPPPPPPLHMPFTVSSPQSPSKGRGRSRSRSGREELTRAWVEHHSPRSPSPRTP
eukprot:Sspe_Gene.29555::Locus_14102_Transcript_1_1_Confidence_1.000_Length_740::g.29555::m.29555